MSELEHSQGGRGGGDPVASWRSISDPGGQRNEIRTHGVGRRVAEEAGKMDLPPLPDGGAGSRFRPVLPSTFPWQESKSSDVPHLFVSRLCCWVYAFGPYAAELKTKRSESRRTRE